MADIKPGNTFKSAELELGKQVNIGTSRMVKFQIKTSGGTVISGIIPANEYLEVTNGGDIKSADISIYDIPKGPHEV